MRVDCRSLGKGCDLARREETCHIPCVEVKVQYVSDKEIANWRADKARQRMELLSMPDRWEAQRIASACPPSSRISVIDFPDYPEDLSAVRER